MKPIKNPMFTPNVNQAKINGAILKTADEANKAEFKASIDDSIKNIFKNSVLTDQEKSSQALLIQQARTFNLLS